MTDIDDVALKVEMARSEIKVIERHARVVKQLLAQADDILESYSLEEAQGNERHSNTVEKE